MPEIIAYPLGRAKKLLGGSGGAGDKVPDEFGDVGRIQQRGLYVNASAESAIYGSGIDDVPIQDETQDLQLHQGTGRQCFLEQRTNAGIGNILQLSYHLRLTV